MKGSLYIKFNQILFGVFLASLFSVATAEIIVDKSQGQLAITSDMSGLVIAKVIGPDDVIVVNNRYQGDSFYWAPSSGPDGAYRYDIRILEESISENKEDKSILSEYAGGSIEVINGVIPVLTEEGKVEEVQ